MPISMVCPKCQAKHRYADHLEGERTKCKSCGARFVLQPDADHGSGSNTGLLIGLGAGIGLFAVIVAGTSILNRPAAQANNAPPVASNTDDPVAPSVPVSPVDPPAVPQRLPVAATSAANANDSATTPSGTGFGQPTAASSGTGGFAATADSADSATLFELSQPWKLQADPGLITASVEQGKNLRIPLANDALQGNGVLFPVSHSPFFAVLGGTISRHRYEIYDASTGKKTGEVPASYGSTPAALSDDGKYLAVSLRTGTVEVYDIPGKKSLGVLTLSADNTFNLESLAIWNHRLVALSTVHRAAKVWELPSGNLVHTLQGTDKFSSSSGKCYSPGGRYLAVIGDFLSKQIDLYDLQEGRLVASITPSKDSNIQNVEALGFSRDGSQLAAAYLVRPSGLSAQAYSRFQVWDLVTGQPQEHFSIEPSFKDQLNPVYHACSLESLPGGTRWLVTSSGIVDTSVKKLIFGFPAQPDVRNYVSRRVMGNDWMLSVMNGPGGARLEATAVTEQELLAAVTAAESGGLASDARLPPLTEFDVSLARTVQTQPNWSAQADAAEMQPLKPKFTLDVTGTLRDLVISRSAHPIVVARTGIRENLEDPELRREQMLPQSLLRPGQAHNPPQPVAEKTELLAVDREGNSLARFELPYSVKLRSVSPDGTLVLVEEHRTNGRLDLYELNTAAKHRLGWRPFRDAANKDHRDIVQAEFLADNRIATVSVGAKLIVWETDPLTAAWKLDDALRFAVSPGGNQLAVTRGNITHTREVALFNAETGEGLGRHPLTGETHVRSLMYSPQGDELAFGTTDSANKTVHFLDVNTGVIAEEIAVPVDPLSLHWTSPQHLLINGEQMLDRNLQMVVWTYRSSDLVPSWQQAGPLVTIGQKTGRRALIHTLALPDESLKKKFGAASLAEISLVKPGDKVELVITISPEPELQSVRDLAQSAVEQRLQEVDIHLQPGAPVRVNVTVSVKNLGTTQISRIGNRDEKETVSRKSIELLVQYEKQGQVIWKNQKTFDNLSRTLMRVRSGQSVQQSLDEQMVEACTAVLEELKLPAHVFRSDASQGLGSSPLLGN